MSIFISNEISNLEYQYENAENWLITISGASDIAINNDQMINWTNISEVNFGTDLRKIDAFCCAGIELQKATIQNTITDIGPYAFYFSLLPEISLPKNLSSLGEMTFFFNNLKNITIPEKITEIPYECFCANELTNVVLCGQITSFFEGCFANNKLSSITLQTSLKFIEKDAFAYNDFASINIPSNIMYIGSGAFQSNSYLSSVTLPNNLNLYSNPFYNCKHLSSLTCYNIDFSKSPLRKAGNEIANGNKLVIGIDGNDCGSGLLDSSITAIGSQCYACNSYNPPGGWYLNLSESNSNVLEIGYESFTFCSGLKRINLGNQISSIQADAFNNCDLTAIDNIPNKLTTFSARLFYGNKNLSSICIPQNISAIYEECFDSCDSLVSVIMSGDYEQVPELYGTVFPECSKIYLKNTSMIDKFKMHSKWNELYNSGKLSVLD